MPIYRTHVLTRCKPPRARPNGPVNATRCSPLPFGAAPILCHHPEVYPIRLPPFPFIADLTRAFVNAVVGLLCFRDLIDLYISVYRRQTQNNACLKAVPDVAKGRCGCGSHSLKSNSAKVKGCSVRSKGMWQCLRMMCHQVISWRSSTSSLSCELRTLLTLLSALSIIQLRVSPESHRRRQ